VQAGHSDTLKVCESMHIWVDSLFFACIGFARDTKVDLLQLEVLGTREFDKKRHISTHSKTIHTQKLECLFVSEIKKK